MNHDAGELPFLIAHGPMVWKLALAATIVGVCALVVLIRGLLVRLRIAAPRISRIALAAIAVVSGAIGWKVEATLGDSWLDRCRALRPSTRFFEPVAFHDAPLDTRACELAAATPDRRDEALTAMLAELDADPYRDEATVRRIDQLSERVETCEDRTDRLLRDARYDDAAAVAHRCGDRRREHLALRDAGKLDEAIAVVVPEERFNGESLSALPDGAEWILTGHWKEAAAAAAARADRLRSPGQGGDDRRSVEMTALHYQCLAELLHHRAGDPAAAGRLRALSGGEYGGVCAPALSQIATGDERRRLLTESPDDVLRETDAVREQLGWVEGLVPRHLEFVTAEALLADPEGSIAGHVSPDKLWLAAAAPASTPPSPTVLRWSTAADVFAGDLARAAITARAAAAAVAHGSLEARRADRRQLGADLQRLRRAFDEARRSHDGKQLAAVNQELSALEQRSAELEQRERQFDAEAVAYEQANARFVGLLPALVALRTPQAPIPVDAPASASDDAASPRLEFVPLWLRNADARRARGLDEVPESLLRAAEDGDGITLATALLTPRFARWTDTQVMAVLPRITIHREAVIRQLAWSAPPSNPLQADVAFPGHLALRAAARRDLFRIAGAADLAARWDAIFQRFDHALRDRDRLVALLLWELRRRYY